jgi:hypothetical protein
MHQRTPHYDEDFYAWTQAQAALLRAEQWPALDITNIAEELESLGKRERKAFRSRLVILVAHLLKWRYQAAWQTPSWRYTIREQRLAIAELLTESPSLRPEGPMILSAAYPRARLRALRETRLAEATIPETCPWTVEQVLEETFWPDEPPDDSRPLRQIRSLE